MTALLSSPLASFTQGSTSRYDPFEQPGSPSFSHADLPAEFGDQSFGSSMSLGSSLDLNRIASGSTNGGIDLRDRHHSRHESVDAHVPNARASTASQSSIPTRRSPPRSAHEGLGAAMGTVLNSKSPGLAAKMNSSPHYMDMSPLPASHKSRSIEAALKEETPLKQVTRRTAGKNAEEAHDNVENLPPGSAMKEDTSFSSTHHTSQDAVHRQAEAYGQKLQGGSLGRLFGTELSMHKERAFGASSKDSAQSSAAATKAGGRASIGCVFGGHGKLLGAETLGDDSFGSPDKEPPPKRRPSSLPISHFSGSSQRPSLRSAGLGPPVSSSGTAASGSSSASSRQRPNLLKSMTTGHAVADENRPTSSNKRTSLEHLRQQYRTSDSVVPTLGRQSRSRAGSMERAGSGSNDGDQPRLLQKSSLPLPLHPTIIESPSPSKTGDDFAGYFFDPQSPEMQRASQQACGSRMTSDNQPSISSIVQNGMLRVRSGDKSNSSASIPSTSNSMLGKRANPYARRHTNAPNVVDFAASVAAPEAMTRFKIPAPRRCQSALDNSAAFQLAGAALAAASGDGSASLGVEDMSLGSVDDSFSADPVLGGGGGAMHPGDLSLEDASPSVLRDARQQSQSTIRLPPGFDASGSPIAPTARAPGFRPNLFRRPSKDDSSPLGYGKRFAATQGALIESDDTKTASPRAAGHANPQSAVLSPVDQYMPGFGASEREGKILPCFNVKDDGLMRITPDTLVELMDGRYAAQTDGFHIVDCRFDYEYEGGHIRGAINLSSMDKVTKHFLDCTQSGAVEKNRSPRRLPLRSQSGKADKAGKMAKKIVVFHCEFSLKRGPSSALALRQADRALAHDYPNCHYPEVYVLQGGYCGFYKKFANACSPQGYIQMDDPRYLQRRSVELNGFRKQFSRHRSFAYGEAYRQTHSDGTLVQQMKRQSASTAIKSLSRPPIEEEDSSFDNSGSSPSTLQSEALLARRRGLARHATAASVLGSASVTMAAAVMEDARVKQRSTRTNASSLLGVRPVLKAKGEQSNEGKAAATCVGDLSFGSSCCSNEEEDTSIDASTSGFIGDSPCAAATAAASGQSRKVSTTLAPGPIKSFQRALSSSAAYR